MDSFENEVNSGERFKFGENWKQFLSTLDEERISEAEASLKSMLGVDDFSGLKFLDIGCGSGLFSLAARRLGAQVFSLDYDPESVACAQTLKQRFFPGDEAWNIESGSALDADYIGRLGKFDVVYSWGVLHHTGDMWLALENAAQPVKRNGKLFISIYNDQDYASSIWLKVKQAYNRGGWVRGLVMAAYIPYFALQAVAAGIVRDGNPLSRFTQYRKERGMSLYHDWIDWLGGLPFEVAKAEEVFEFYKAKGFRLEKLKTTNRLGTNEFVFTKVMARIENR